MFYAVQFFASFAVIQSLIFEHPAGGDIFGKIIALLLVWTILLSSFWVLRASLSDYRQGEQPPVAHFAEIFIKLIFGFAIGSSLFDVFIKQWFS